MRRFSIPAPFMRFDSTKFTGQAVFLSIQP
jgi:hypothetical protein